MEYKVGKFSKLLEEKNRLSEIDGQNSSLQSNSDYVWRDLKAEFVVKNTSGGNNPTFGEWRPGMEGLLFSGSNMNQVWVDFHIDHDYAVGTRLYPHVHWLPLTNVAGVVRWGIQYSIAKGHGQGLFDTITTVYMNHEIGINNQYRHYVTETTDQFSILSDKVEPDSVIKMRVFREGAIDSHNGVIHAWQADLHYQVARIETVNKAPNFFVK